MIYFQTGGLEEYLSNKEIPPMISLLVTIASQHKEVFKRYLKNWMTGNVVYESAVTPNQIGETSSVIQESAVSIMLLRILQKVCDCQSNK